MKKIFNQNDKIKILVIRFKRIGDAILALPLCHSLKLTFPNAELDYVLYEEMAPLFYNHPYIDNVISIKENDRKNIFRYIKRVHEITKKNYDIIIDIMSTPKSEVFSLFSMQSPYRIGRYKKYRGLFYTHRTKILRTENKIDELLNQLLPPLEKEGYILKINNELKFKADNKETEKYKKLMLKQGVDFSKIIVAFSIFSRVKSKIYPMEKMKEVVNYLIDKFDAQIIFFYSKDQKDDIQKIHRDMGNHKNIFSNIETPTIIDLLPLFENCDYYVGNEGGGRHLAQGIGLPSLAIFNPNAFIETWLPFPSDTNIGISPTCTLAHHFLTKEEYKNLNFEEKFKLIEVKMITDLIDKLITDKK